MAVAAVATGDLVRSLLREESLSSRGVSLVGRSFSRQEESLSSGGVSLIARELLVARSLSLRGVSHCEESLSSRGVSREDSLVARSLSSRGGIWLWRRSHRGAGGEGQQRGQDPEGGDGGRLIARRAGDTTIKM